MHGSVVVDGRTYCTDCGSYLGVGSFEAFNHRQRGKGVSGYGRGECPYKASGKYFIPDDVRVRDAIFAHNYDPAAHQVRC